MGKRSRDKGAAWERECARLLTFATGRPCVRELRETREGNVGDVDCQGIPLSIQCKVGARPPVWEAVKQAEEAAKDGYFSAAMLKRNGAGGRPAERVVVMPLDDWVEIIYMLCSYKVWR